MAELFCQATQPSSKIKEILSFEKKITPSLYCYSASQLFTNYMTMLTFLKQPQQRAAIQLRSPSIFCLTPVIKPLKTKNIGEGFMKSET